MKKKIKNAWKSSKGNGKLEVMKDQKSGTRMSRSPKKVGHGGKFTWVGGTKRWALKRKLWMLRTPTLKIPKRLYSPYDLI
ncbi:hypothetical protein TorRG33x02_038350 [Trema orientale]|uniref:Uncharacterized protein n=1 Tax=Trema orientale TaxID=63057 RepID=A0A2P5FRN8_TREOI|nr:hypothetical protein TorRG33x02_038350 [Trema orientale]